MMDKETEKILERLENELKTGNVFIDLIKDFLIAIVKQMDEFDDRLIALENKETI